ncbi:MAG TPA: M15 family metallopeptidase [Longimicrobiales bacterium]
MRDERKEEEQVDVVVAPPSIAAVAPQGGAREELRPRAGDEGSAFAAALSGALRQGGAERPKEPVRQRAAEGGAPAAGQHEEDRTADEVAMAVVAALVSPESPQLPAGPTVDGSAEAGGATAGLAAPASAVVEAAAAVPAPADGAEPAAGRAGATTAAPRDALAELDPLFRSRLKRVRSRMEAEFGHKVEIVEGYRDQARQDLLYAQGRTRPGPIVTWTRNSLHTEGRAADVMIDGSYDNPAAYERLAQVAREEGLRTLWPKDPGHIELPRESSAKTGSAATGAQDALAQDALARVARVATVAQVARPAEPAVASPAIPAAPGMAGQAGAGGAASSSAATGAGLDAAVRVSELLEITSVASARPRSHVLLDVRDADGKPTRIRVDLRGAALAATIDAADPAAAERLAARLGELHRALERQGVENAMLRVRTQAQASVDALRSPTRAGESLASGLATMLPRADAAVERRPAGSDAPFHQGGRDPQADPHRSRRDQRQERSS